MMDYKLKFYNKKIVLGTIQAAVLPNLAVFLFGNFEIAPEKF